VGALEKGLQGVRRRSKVLPSYETHEGLHHPEKSLPGHLELVIDSRALTLGGEDEEEWP
jgi:hypothetical protein